MLDTHDTLVMRRLEEKGVGMSTKDTPRDPADDEALRQEIQAAIKAGRELDPEMDGHLADSVLDRYRQEQAARNKALARVPTPAAPQAASAPGLPGGSSSGEMIARTVLGVVCVGAFVAVMLVNWHLFWLFFFLPGLVGGWWGWGRRGHRDWTRHGPPESRRYLRIERMRSELSQAPSGTIHYD